MLGLNRDNTGAVFNIFMQSRRVVFPTLFKKGRFCFPPPLSKLSVSTFHFACGWLSQSYFKHFPCFPSWPLVRSHSNGTTTADTLNSKLLTIKGADALKEFLQPRYWVAQCSHKHYYCTNSFILFFFSQLQKSSIPYSSTGSQYFTVHFSCSFWPHLEVQFILNSSCMSSNVARLLRCSDNSCGRHCLCLKRRWRHMYLWNSLPSPVVGLVNLA